MTFNYGIGDGADALFWNQIIAAFNETYWSSGWDASVGGGSWDVDIASGDGVVQGSTVSTSSTGTVTLSSSSTDPRKDVIYVNSSGTLQSLEGTTASATPAGETRSDTYQPSPPDASGITGIVVAEVWVGGGAGSLSSGDIRDRRVPSPTYADEDAQDAVGNILSSQFTYDDAGDAINLDPHANTTDAHHTKPSTTQDAAPNTAIAFEGYDGTKDPGTGTATWSVNAPGERVRVTVTDSSNISDDFELRVFEAGGTQVASSTFTITANGTTTETVSFSATHVIDVEVENTTDNFGSDRDVTVELEVTIGGNHSHSI